MNTLAELRAAYPGCPNFLAVEFSRQRSEEVWAIARRCNNSPQQVITAIREVLAEVVDGYRVAQVGTKVCRMALAELDHPDCRAYIAGKLGAM